MTIRVLIVDDDPDNVSYLKDILEEEGYQTITAGDGVEGLQKARSHRPDLVLLDLMMPNKSGIRMFQELKKDKDLRGIPVIIVTGVSQATGVDFRDFVVRLPGGEGEPMVSPKGDTTYAKPSAYLEKPIEPGQLAITVKEVLKREGILKG